MGTLFPDDPEYPDYRSMPSVAVKFLGMTIKIVPAVVLVVTVGFAPLCPVPHKLGHQPHDPQLESVTPDAGARDAGVSTGGAGGDVTVDLTGVSATASVGTLAPSTTAVLSGVSSTAAVGSLAPSITVALTGVRASLL